MAFPFHSSGLVKPVDFNYPKDVSKEALSDLDKALKNGDGQMTVNALVRYSIAQSGISQDNMPDIVNQLETVINKEKQPHIRALLNYFEATVYESYLSRYGWGRKRNNPVEETPTDISEWSREQFEHKIVELTKKSIADVESLAQVPVTSLSEIMVYNELGTKYVPTMKEFMLMKGLDLLDDIDEGEGRVLRDAIKYRWVDETQGDIPAHIYAMTSIGKSISKEDYEKYKDSEYSALLLKHMYFQDGKERYKTLKEYVKRFPKSPFTPEIQNDITEIESMSVYLDYPKTRSSHDSIPVTMSVDNVNSFDIIVYSVPESAFDEYGRLNTALIKEYKTYPMTVSGTVPFSENNIKTTLPPLPYGMYIISTVKLKAGNKLGGGYSNLDYYDILRVTDMAMISINRRDYKDKIGTVNINTGKPIPGVTIKYNYGKDVSGTMGLTNAKGLVAVPESYPDPKDKNYHLMFSGMELKASKGDDKYASSI